MENSAAGYVTPDVRQQTASITVTVPAKHPVSRERKLGIWKGTVNFSFTEGEKPGYLAHPGYHRYYVLCGTKDEVITITSVYNYKLETYCFDSVIIPSNILYSACM